MIPDRLRMKHKLKLIYYRRQHNMFRKLMNTSSFFFLVHGDQHSKIILATYKQQKSCFCPHKWSLDNSVLDVSRRSLCVCVCVCVRACVRARARA
jgi:hypothetical protein